MYVYVFRKLIFFLFVFIRNAVHFVLIRLIYRLHSKGSRVTKWLIFVIDVVKVKKFVSTTVSGIFSTSRSTGYI